MPADLVLFLVLFYLKYVWKIFLNSKNCVMKKFGYLFCVFLGLIACHTTKVDQKGGYFYSAADSRASGRFKEYYGPYSKNHVVWDSVMSGISGAFVEHLLVESDQKTVDSTRRQLVITINPESDAFERYGIGKTLEDGFVRSDGQILVMDISNEVHDDTLRYFVFKLKDGVRVGPISFFIDK